MSIFGHACTTHILVHVFYANRLYKIILHQLKRIQFIQLYYEPYIFMIFSFSEILVIFFWMSPLSGRLVRKNIFYQLFYQWGPLATLGNQPQTEFQRDRSTLLQAIRILGSILQNDIHKYITSGTYCLSLTRRQQSHASHSP